MATQDEFNRTMNENIHAINRMNWVNAAVHAAIWAIIIWQAIGISILAERIRALEAK